MSYPSVFLFGWLLGQVEATLLEVLDFAGGVAPIEGSFVAEPDDGPSLTLPRAVLVEVPGTKKTHEPVLDGNNGRGLAAGIEPDLEIAAREGTDSNDDGFHVCVLDVSVLLAVGASIHDEGGEAVIGHVRLKHVVEDLRDLRAAGGESDLGDAQTEDPEEGRVARDIGPAGLRHGSGVGAEGLQDELLRDGSLVRK